MGALLAGGLCWGPRGGRMEAQARGEQFERGSSWPWRGRSHGRAPSGRHHVQIVHFLCTETTLCGGRTVRLAHRAPKTPLHARSFPPGPDLAHFGGLYYIENALFCASLARPRSLAARRSFLPALNSCPHETILVS